MNENDASTAKSDDAHPKMSVNATFDPEKDSASEELIAAIATINDVDPTELELLAHSIDPDALDTLMSPRKNGSQPNGEAQISFNYAGHIVHIQSNGSMMFHADGGGD